MGVGAITSRPPLAVYAEVNTPGWYYGSKRAERRGTRREPGHFTQPQRSCDAGAIVLCELPIYGDLDGRRGGESVKTTGTRHENDRSTTPESPRVRVLRGLSTWPSTPFHGRDQLTVEPGHTEKWPADRKPWYVPVRVPHKVSQPCRHVAHTGHMHLVRNITQHWSLTCL